MFRTKPVNDIYINITTLSDKEKKELSDLTKQIFSEKKDEESKGESAIKSLPPSKVFKFTQADSRFKNYCETNDELHQAWKVFLEASAYPSTDLIPVGEKLRTVYHLYVGAYLLSTYTQNDHAFNRNKLLDAACDNAVYQALVERLNLTQAEFKKDPDALQTKKETLLTRFTNDIQTLCEHYESIGYLRASGHSRDLAEVLISQNDDWSQKKAQELIDRAVKYFLLSIRTQKSDWSSELIDSVTKGKGLFSILSEDSQTFTTEDEIKAYIMALLNNDENRYKQIVKNVETEYTKLGYTTETSSEEKTSISPKF